MDVKIAAEKTIDRLVASGRAWDCFNSAVSSTHIFDMLHQIERGERVGDQAHRWLGWAQAIICVHNGATLEELKKINHES